jgi:hypothetical protein
MRILLVHGVGHQERPDNQPWERSWEEAITAGIQYFDPAFAPTYERFDYDNLFSGTINLFTDVGAAAHLGFAPLGAAIEDAAQTVSGWFRPRRGLLDWAKPVADAADGWHAGMVAEWDQNAPLRATLRKRLIERINTFNPDVIMAHSLGSIICYDAFSHEDKNGCAGRYLVTFGSQIANPFLKAAHFDNKIGGVNQKYWFHLFNKSDPVLAHRIVDRVSNFEEISWDDRVAGHDAIVDLDRFPDHAGYLQRDLTWQRVYRVLAQRPGVRALASRSAKFQSTLQQRRRRALLVGVNNYPDPASRLEGCVNDVFLMSSVLQKSGLMLKISESCLTSAQRLRRFASGLTGCSMARPTATNACFITVAMAHSCRTTTRLSESITSMNASCRTIFIGRRTALLPTTIFFATTAHFHTPRNFSPFSIAATPVA